MNVRFMFPEGMGYLKGSVPVQTHDINLNMSYVPPVGSEVWVGSEYYTVKSVSYSLKAEPPEVTAGLILMTTRSSAWSPLGLLDLLERWNAAMAEFCPGSDLVDNPEGCAEHIRRCLEAAREAVKAVRAFDRAGSQS